VILDLHDLDPRRDLETDLCVIGGGAAGITLARSLAGTPIDVLLLESGGLEQDPVGQALYRGESVGLLPSSALEACRLRYFGGTTNHWGGWCAPLEGTDFERRTWVPASGWPIERRELERYYESAQQLCGLARFDYDTRSWFSASPGLPDFAPEKVVTRMWQISDPPVRFGSRYRDELERAGNVTTVLGANVSRLETTGNGRLVSTARIQTLTGRSQVVRARRFVLACGAIENARLLLLSDGVERDGVGNRRGLVGRFFMQHPHVPTATIHATGPRELASAFRRRDREGVGLRPCLCPGVAAQRRERILGCSMSLEHELDRESGYVAVREIGRSLRDGEVPDTFGADVLDVLADLGGAAESLGDGIRGEFEPPVSGVSVYTRSEQAPDPDSRISLGERRDALGAREVEMDWRLSELDRRTIRVAHRLLAEELGRLGLGQVQLAEWLGREDGEGPSWPDALHSGCHHMGTTRMADDPGRGVVDSDARVHGVANLYIAGSSVFPTSGWANPTLTLVALTLRLAEHLRIRT
jgi:choline dehydrogenase-like flavoprotein